MMPSGKRRCMGFGRLRRGILRMAIFLRTSTEILKLSMALFLRKPVGFRFLKSWIFVGN